MFNPFEPFNGRMIDAFRKNGKRFLVSQTYPRGKDLLTEDQRQPLLFSHYEDQSKAQIHLSALRGDRYAAVIDLENEKHREKIMEMLLENSRYWVFSTLIKSMEIVEERLNTRFRQNMRRYIDQNTTWRIPANETVLPVLDIAFGELFLILKYRRNQIRIKLEELEKI